MRKLERSAGPAAQAAFAKKAANVKATKRHALAHRLN